MFDEFRLKEALVSYKRDFAQKLWPNEKYKWQAVKCFQLNWDVNATDFAEMLKKSLSATANLLASVNNFPARMIQKFAEIVPEEVRAMYIELFDESKDTFLSVKDKANLAEILEVSTKINGKKFSLAMAIAKTVQSYKNSLMGGICELEFAGL